MKLEGKVVVAQGGGPTAVVDFSLWWVWYWNPVNSPRFQRFMAQLTGLKGLLMRILWI